METYFLRAENLLSLYEHINQEYELFVPIKTKTPFKVKCEYGFNLPSDDYLLKRFSEVKKEDIVFSEYRAVEPTRAFFTHFKEEIGRYFESQEGKGAQKPLAICGIKNCDIFSLKIQDYVFLQGNEEDALYKERRAQALIISGDCPSFKEACFCRAFEINPHVTEGFDLNLSPINDGYLLDVASDKARKMVDGIKNILTPANAGQLSGRAAKRDSVIKRMEEHLSCHKIPKKDTLQDIVLSGYNSQVWNEQMRTCVECGGCVFMCDTCHCFLLTDDVKEGSPRRVRIWDGCLYKNFSRVAGGANPLRMRYMRLRNRYLKKFDFFISNLGFQACCGCGRCIDVCPGRIDIRYILRRLYEEKHIPAHSG
ncbi:MAG: 4Fe-4S dicluster domain-containing protein [Candidatus Omnitrophota bacterium]